MSELSSEEQSIIHAAIAGFTGGILVGAHGKARAAYDHASHIANDSIVATLDGKHSILMGPLGEREKAILLDASLGGTSVCSWPSFLTGGVGDD